MRHIQIAASKMDMDWKFQGLSMEPWLVEIFWDIGMTVACVTFGKDVIRSRVAYLEGEKYIWLSHSCLSRRRVSSLTTDHLDGIKLHPSQPLCLASWMTYSFIQYARHSNFHLPSVMPRLSYETFPGINMWALLTLDIILVVSLLDNKEECFQIIMKNRNLSAVPNPGFFLL